MKSNLYLAMKCLVVSAIFATGTSLNAQSNVNVTQKLPAEVKAGDSFDVTFTINKDNLQSFARLQHNLPVGFKATLKNGKDYHAFASENKAKLVWVSLPKSKEFTVTYSVKVSNKLAGEYKFAGEFDYVANNVKQYSIIAPVTIKVLPNALAALSQDDFDSTPVGGSTAYDENIFDN